MGIYPRNSRFIDLFIQESLNYTLKMGELLVSKLCLHKSVFFLKKSLFNPRLSFF